MTRHFQKSLVLSALFSLHFASFMSNNRTARILSQVLYRETALFLQNHSKTTKNSHLQLQFPKMALIPSLRSSVFDPFSTDIWNPFDGIFNIAIPDTARETSAFVNTRIDWKETPEAHIFKADVPGLKKEEVKVEVEEGRILQISGERSKEQEEKNDKWHRIERSSGKFMRRFRLPENAKMDQVKAGMENGVLTVTIPKEEIKKPEVKAIEISG